jgi:multisubunit Na+/H+ antiporter MnhG subunit
MGLVQKHAILTAVGIILSIMAVAWLQPNEVGGTTFVVVVLLLMVNAVGAIFIRSSPAAGDQTGPH